MKDAMRSLHSLFCGMMIGLSLRYIEGDGGVELLVAAVISLVTWLVFLWKDEAK